MIISFTDISRDPRVNRQILFLKDNYRVIAVGSGNPGLDGVRYINCKIVRRRIDKKIVAAGLLSLGIFEKYYWDQQHIRECLKKLRDIKVDFIIVNDIDCLPLSLKIANDAKIIFDAHEYAPKQFEDLWHWRLFRQRYREYLCGKYLPKVDAMTTVCQGIADEYEIKYGVEPVVVTNAPNYESIEPHLTDPERIRLIHHGIAAKSRRIENMILMMNHLDDRFELDLILIPGFPNYIEKMKKLAQHNSKIRFLPPVPMRELAKFSSQYDIGLFLLEPTNFNYRHALPNKFFEFIQARLAIAIGPSPEMARIVKEYECGIVGDDFSPKTLAHCLMDIGEKKIDYFKCQSHKIARIMSSEQNKAKILKIIDDLEKK